MPNYTVVLEWVDRRDGEGDADEIRVSAPSEEEAISKARQEWRMTIGAEFPRCKLHRTWVLTKEKAAGFL